MIGSVTGITGFSELQFCVTDSFCLADIPVLGEIFFSHEYFDVWRVLLVPISVWLLKRDDMGLGSALSRTKPGSGRFGWCQRQPGTLRSGHFGFGVGRYCRRVASISCLNVFQENMINGIGFIAVALVYFGGWSPVGVMFGALLFSTISALQFVGQVLGLNISSNISVMLPRIF